MSKKLFIVEAPGKVKSISAYLDQIEPGGWIVKASAGHVRDLHKDRFSIDLHSFKPAYAVYEEKKKLVRELVQLSKTCAGGVFLATDLDREGEAIAWHIAKLLNLDLKSSNRVVYNEISKQAIQNALTQTRPIAMNRVVSQEARRFIDRIVGYTVSPLLHKVVKSSTPLSGGRVQSVVLMMIQERCHKIKNFVPVEYFGVKAHFKDGVIIPFSAAWNSEKHQVDGYMTNKGTAASLVSKIKSAPVFYVTDISEKPVQVVPPKPFTTSTLQQTASKKLGISIDSVMKAAQKLYESGHISYMRTDSFYLAEDFVETVRTYIKGLGQEKKIDGLLPATPNVFKSGANAQEAHEAIRPTKIDRLPDEIQDPLEKQVYQLIRDRTIACQMASGQDLSTVVHLLHESTKEPFTLKGRIVKFLGWRSLFEDVADDDKENDSEEESSKLPKLHVGQKLEASDADVTSDKTKPPPYFTQATLVREMEKNNVGRPSTTASVIKVNFDRGYIEEQGSGKKAKIVITSLGEQVCLSMKGVFTFMDVKYTGQLESALDLLATGKAEFLQIMSIFSKTYDNNLRDFCKKNGLSEVSLLSFSDDITKSSADIAKSKIPENAVSCPACKTGYLKSINGSNGTFWVCSNSKKTKPCTAKFPDFKSEPYLQRHKCPQCDKDLRIDLIGGNYKWTCFDKSACGFSTFANPNGTPKL
jgi:DNA topoisomerase-1